MTPAAFGQERRLLAIDTPLGADTLVVQAFTGVEEMSRPFAFELSLLSHEHEIAAKDLVGKAVTLSVQPEDGEPRFFHGHVARLTAQGLFGRDFRAYHATVVPWLWFLSKRSSCRIFQEKSVIEIAEQIFGELKFSDYETSNARGPFPKLDYCVQYRESDLDFLSRLFEEAGIFYYFRHEEKKHVLVLADAKLAYADCDEKEVAFSVGDFAEPHVSRWEHQYAFVSGAWAHADYNFETPLTQLRSTAQTVVELPGTGPYEVYDYPGRYPDGGAGDDRVKIRMEEEEAAWDVVLGGGTCRTFTLGGKFKLKSHECADEKGKEYAITSLRHMATDSSFEEGAAGGSKYENEFRCIPSSVVYRPPRMTPKAVVGGPQTAVVVGPSGEEIYTDAHGRVKVQFHWDRDGKNDEKSSCWVRVSQGWAGKGWGSVSLPRIGQEVVVDFLEGDPDRPLVTGRVYNADQTPPWALPANATQSGVKTRSSKEGTGDNCNELRFEDKKGSELVFLHAEKDETIEVENDQQESIGHDQTITVENDQTIAVKSNRDESIDKDRSLTVGGSKTESVGKNKSVTVGGNHTEDISGDMTVSVAKGLTVSVGKDLGETVSGSMSVSVSKDQSSSIGGNLSIKVSKDAKISVDGNETSTITKNLVLKAKKIQFTGEDEVVIKAGSATIQLKKNGDITIDGKKITVKGSGDLILKGSKIAAN